MLTRKQLQTNPEPRKPLDAKREILYFSLLQFLPCPCEESQCAICIVFMPRWVLCIQPPALYLTLVPAYQTRVLSDQTLALKLPLPSRAGQPPRMQPWGGTGSRTRPSAPANTPCSLPRKWLSGKGLPANKMDLNQ